VQYNDETLELSVEVEELESKLAPQSSSSFMDFAAVVPVSRDFVRI
jgi:hypothetical protein